MLISIHMNKNFIYIIIFTIVNSIMTYLYEKLKNIVKNSNSLIYDLFSDISKIFLIIFYFIEKYKSKLKSEEEGITLEKNFEKYNQFSMEQVFFFVSLLIFKIIYNYNIIIFDNKINLII